MELFTDLYGVFAVPTMEGFTRRTGIVLYRQETGRHDPGRIRMVDMKNKFYGNMTMDDAMKAHKAKLSS